MTLVVIFTNLQTFLQLPIFLQYKSLRDNISDNPKSLTKAESFAIKEYCKMAAMLFMLICNDNPTFGGREKCCPF